ncbi:MAG: branched-chain amino acid ABC transporter permease [Rhodoferax sp.]|uniref:branched-chain amino acid ABC transporter permease n=1 Tax=Rhodoferax sp. TaxID=50421 RepID=UPI003265D2E6
MRLQRTRNIKVMLVLLLLLAVVLPLVANGYWTKTLISAVAIAVAVSGVSLLYGQLGLVSLSQYALVGVGGWVALRLSLGFQWPFELCVLAAGASASAAGMVAGLPALRMKGLYLALVTLMMAGGYQVLINALGFPDGGDGWLGKAVGTDRALMGRPYLAESDGMYLAYVVVWLAAVLLLVEVHKLSKPGRAWALIRRGEAAANAAGVDVLRYQTWAFGLAGFCAGVAGALLAGGVGQLDGRAFGASESVMLFALAVVGGVYHWLGVLLAGLLLRAVPALLTDFGVNGYIATMFFGASLLHALTTAHRGIAGQLLDRVAALRRRLVARPAAAEVRHD